MTDDLSPRVIQLARMIDRLPAGTFNVELVKPEDKTIGWHVTIVQPVTLREVVLNKAPLRIDTVPPPLSEL